ncbi:MAG: hypothetical protein AAF762_02940 [Pseudomonadota bacterium]
MIGALAVTIHVARRDRLGIKDALMTMIGMRDFKKSPRLSAFIIAVFLVPLGLWFVLYEQCQAAL